MKTVGIDIGKRKFDVALLVQGKVRSKVFENTPVGHQGLLGWLQERGCEVSDTRLCMEATSQYYEAVATVLHEAGYWVSVVNPLQIKAFGQTKLRRQKTDRADAGLIAQFCEQTAELKVWQPPAPEIKELQRLLARLEAVQQMRVQELNRRHESAGVARESVERILKVLEEELGSLEKRIRDHIDQNPGLREQHGLLTSIPGVGDRVSTYYLAWLRSERFMNVRQAVAFVGLSPQHHDSGDSVHGKPRVGTVGHGRLRKILYMPAMSAARSNPAAKALSERLKAAGKSGKVILCAVMRKLIHWMFGVLNSKQPFDLQRALAKC